MAELGEAQSVDLYMPPVLETSEYLQEELLKHFQHVSVRPASCPDLRSAPFGLISAGLGGSPLILQVGGVKNVFPCPNRQKVYDLQSVARACNLNGVTLYGAGGGPVQTLGSNSESVINAKTSDGGRVIARNYLTRWLDNGGYECVESTVAQISYIGDCFVSNGLPGRVMRVELKRRISEEAADLLALLRKLLIQRFGADRPVGMGGVLLLKRGKANVHIMMPAWNDGPLEVSEVYKTVHVPAPLVGLGVLLTSDCGIALNQSHVHMFSTDGHGGHYHEDVTADQVEYEAYFSFAHRAVHLDAPK